MKVDIQKLLTYFRLLHSIDLVEIKVYVHILTEYNNDSIYEYLI